MQILRDVYMLSGHSYAMHPNMYGIVHPNRRNLILVDSGLAGEDRKVIEENIAYWGLGDLIITQVLITHSHFDHSGNAWYFREKGAQIIAGDGDAQGIEAGDGRTIFYAYPIPFKACKVDRIVKGGETLDLDGLSVNCIAVPGHSKGSIAYQVKTGGKNILFTGDFLMAAQDCANGRPGIAVGEDYDPAAYLASLRKLLPLDIDAVLGGHGHPALVNGRYIIGSAYRNMLVDRTFPGVISS